MGKKIVIQHMSRQTQEFKIHFNCVFYFVQCFDSNSLPAYQLITSFALLLLRFTAPHSGRT